MSVSTLCFLVAVNRGSLLYAILWSAQIYHGNATLLLSQFNLNNKCFSINFTFDSKIALVLKNQINYKLCWVVCIVIYPDIIGIRTKIWLIS